MQGKHMMPGMPMMKGKMPMKKMPKKMGPKMMTDFKDVKNMKKSKKGFKKMAVKKGKN